MPFKTKRRKLRASSRRITISEQGLASYSAPHNLAQDKQERIQDPVKLKSEVSENYGYVRAEIIKTILFGIVIIGLQLFIKFSHIAF